VYATTTVDEAIIAWQLYGDLNQDTNILTPDFLLRAGYIPTENNTFTWLYDDSYYWLYTYNINDGTITYDDGNGWTDIIYYDEVFSKANNHIFYAYQMDLGNIPFMYWTNTDSVILNEILSK
jgi:hypothetical protein